MRFSRDPIVVLEPGVLDYAAAWDLQRSIAEGIDQGTSADTIVLLEHPSVYTAGRRTQPEDRPTDGTPVVDVDRGGRITWHGPGQLVAYPIVRLAEAMNVVGYVRLLEQALIATCADLGVSTIRVAGRSGVWLPADGIRPERKVAAIGVRVAKGITSHGVALNCDPDLAAFERIVPCGIADAGVTSLSAETGRRVSVGQAQPLLAYWLREALDGRLGVGTEHADGTNSTDRADGSTPALVAPRNPSEVDNGLARSLAPA